MPATHRVTNQPPPLTGYDAAATDPALADALAALGSAELLGSLAALGGWAGDERTQRLARAANDFPPVLRTHDRYGNRIDEVDFHPAWHALMAASVAEGLHGSPWARPGRLPHLRRAAGFYLASQAEAGHGCPISMTYAVVPALRHAPELAEEVEPGLTSTAYDFGLRDPATKAGLIAGMAMTEKQGGSDVRANQTRAVPAGDGSWRLTGHKWFCSAPMADLFLVLAQVDGAGLTSFCVPRVLPGGERNPFALQRLKDKLGNRSNASAEVEFDQTAGWPVGAPGEGLRTILEMVTMTRLDCVIGSAAGQRAAVVQAVHHARHRTAFGAPLIEQPVMRAVLADLVLETEAATWLFLRLGRAVDQGERAFLRLAVAAAKFWVCKRSPAVVGEALECLGGNGYVEDSGLPRLFRESPLNSIWEGAGNVIALDVVRALSRDTAAAEAVRAELAAARGADRRYDAAVADLLGQSALPEPERARDLARRIAVTLQASLLLRHAPPAVADAFCATRLESPPPVLGTLPAGVDVRAVLERALTA